MNTESLLPILPSFVRRFVCCCAILALSSPVDAENPQSPLAIAVFDFEASDAAAGELASGISTLVSVEFTQDSRFVTVERAELDKVLGEQELGLSGTISEASAAKVGHLTGAQLLVTGRLLKLGNETIVVAKLIGTDTSRVFSHKARLGTGQTPSAIAADLARSISESALQHRSALLAAPEDPEARLAALKKVIEGKPRRRVSVVLPEQHFGRPVIDPAAETEISLLLKQCGFTLVDSSAGGKPEIEVIGEAFSERGLQRGHLIGCRARVEIKVRRVADGEILLADRQVGVAADVAEHVAAKTALQRAARSLADRLIPIVAN